MVVVRANRSPVEASEWPLSQLRNMTPFHLTAPSVMVVGVFDSAHEHLRETEPRNNGVELVGEKAG